MDVIDSDACQLRGSDSGDRYVAEGAGKRVQALFSSNVFTARLIDSAPFALAGATYDLRQMLGHGVTQFGTAAATPIDPPTAPYDLVIPFSGSAIALGGCGTPYSIV